MRATARRNMRAALTAVQSVLPVPWDIDVFVHRLSSHRARRIVLVPWAFRDSGDSTSGMFVRSAAVDYIFYEETASPARREQVIAHEVGHLLLQHTPELKDASDRLLEALAPDVSPAIARRVLALSRTGYEDDDEAAAELFGTSLIQLGTAQPAPSEADELGRLVEVLR